MLKIFNVFMFIFISTTIVNAAPLCNTKLIAENISLLYMGTAPGSSEQDFKTLVVANKDILAANTVTIICMNRLGEQLIEKGASVYDPHAYERVMGINSIQSASDVARSINSGAFHFNYIGKQLQWLSSILPSASTGNFKSFDAGNIERNNIIKTYDAKINFIKLNAPERLEYTLSQVQAAQIFGRKQIYMLSLMTK